MRPESPAKIHLIVEKDWNQRVCVSTTYKGEKTGDAFYPGYCSQLLRLTA